MPTAQSRFAPWRAFMQSFDPEHTTAGSHPATIAMAAGGLTLVFAVIGYLPSLREASGFQAPWIAMLLATAGGGLTYTAWKHRCQGPWGGPATLLDNVCYSAALTYAAVATRGPYAIGLALVHTLVLLLFTAPAYGLTLVFAGAMALPPLLLIPLHRPEVPVTLILVASYVMLLMTSYMGHRRRELLRRQARLEQALHAADRVADVSMQAALASKLITFGHFLHELRNHQAVMASGLALIERGTELDERGRWALQAVKEASQAEQALVAGVVAEVRRRADVTQKIFGVVPLIQRVASEARDLTVDVVHRALAPRVQGVPEHLEIVLENLLRNAAQAGARRIEIEVDCPSGLGTLEIRVRDDGRGIPASGRAQLFEPFHTSTRSAGTGLGLYLCRRYVELMGGSIALLDAPAGTSFSVQLPLALAEENGECDARPLGIHGAAEQLTE